MEAASLGLPEQFAGSSAELLNAFLTMGGACESVTVWVSCTAAVSS